MIAHATAWLEGTALATWTRESPSIWAYPTILTLHTAGLGVVVGASAVIDLRLLGFGRRIPAAALAPLFAIIGWAFALNATTGVVLFMADATAKSKQVVFFVKLALIALALWDTLAQRRLILWDPALAGFTGDGAVELPILKLRRLAVASLILWTGAITAGRLMAYL
ncbi:MAG TPA: hypothetical protein VH417_02620 [Vicinamibacterales bacterium]